MLVGCLGFGLGALVALAFRAAARRGRCRGSFLLGGFGFGLLSSCRLVVVGCCCRCLSGFWLLVSVLVGPGGAWRGPGAGGAAWGGGGLVVLWFWFGLSSSLSLAVLFCPLRGCRRVCCALLPSLFLLFFLCCPPPLPRPRLPPFLFASPAFLFFCLQEQRMLNI